VPPEQPAQVTRRHPEAVREILDRLAIVEVPALDEPERA